MYCKFCSIKSKKGTKYCYCRLFRKEVAFSCYQECDSKEYKQYKPIKKRTYKLAKKENKRFSIIYDDLTKCCECNFEIGIQKNEVFEGAYRQTSIKNGMICPFCENCHRRFHEDIIFNLKYKVKFQEKYMEDHTLEEFISVFGQNYVYKLEKITQNKETNRNG